MFSKIREYLSPRSKNPALEFTRSLKACIQEKYPLEATKINVNQGINDLIFAWLIGMKQVLRQLPFDADKCGLQAIQVQRKYVIDYAFTPAILEDTDTIIEIIKKIQSDSPIDFILIAVKKENN
jgi:hypothetical protein